MFTQETKEFVRVTLTGDKWETLIDRSDWNTLKRKLQIISNGYAGWSERINGQTKTILLHRAIMKAPQGQCVDHINGDKLDNRRRNLRLCDPRQNQWNKKKQTNPTSSRFKGVTWNKQRAKWQAAIKRGYLGLFNLESDAARAYDVAAKEKFGRFAKLNFEESKQS